MDRARNQKVFSERGPILSFLGVFLVDEGIQIPLKVGHYRPASKMPHDGPTLNVGLVAL